MPQIIWKVGELVRLQFPVMRVTGVKLGLENSEHKREIIYTLTNPDGPEWYEFTPNHGLIRIG